MERPSYESYESKPKQERRDIASASGVLERKRFLLSSSPELKERLRKLQDIVYEMKKEHPEVISLSLFGSFTKGYATVESDFDAYLNIDLDTLGKGKKHSGDAWIETKKELHDRLQKNLNLTEKQLSDLSVNFWSIKNLRKNVRGGLIDSAYLLFLMSIGTDINKYRRIVIDQLERRGVGGELEWKYIMARLADFENDGLAKDLREERKKLYPQTVAEGRRYFLHEEPKAMEGIFGKISKLFKR